ncbi:fibroblast growth factor-binding 1-like protein [Labeo rohita]|uniref:Fibroblast growth factor-binding protein 1 n=2 Tax=Labeo rohita TaxID=84645 RepID=A0ABQ8M255_LABRO|nr:fibroblast growth factor-binding protein 1 [Labeo rohita]KAI2656987.1 Fibroblast growth factor-binding protein 1 [Labeo rohita]RXN26858.1 fibroblast growth factor-binding 1-like protein [Labeo rohita]
MKRVTDLALVLIFACIVQQFVPVNSLRDRGKRAQTDGKGKRRGQRHESGLKGRFSLKDGARCSWRAARGDDAFVLGVTCKNGVKTFDCEYVAKPTACQQYVSDTKAYWKQIARSLKKQKSLCRDSTAMVKAGMCRSAPADAHFRLKDKRPSSRPPLPPAAGNNHCPDRIERLKVAEDYCKSAWSSLCTFFFLMLENDECS